MQVRVFRAKPESSSGHFSLHPLDTDSLPWPQLQRSWELWLRCVPERNLMGNAKHYPLQRASGGKGGNK